MLISLNRRHSQLVWDEDAQDVEAWLSEREGELANIMKQPKGRSGNTSSPQQDGENAVMTQLQVLQRQDKFQVSQLLTSIAIVNENERFYAAVRVWLTYEGGRLNWA